MENQQVWARVKEAMRTKISEQSYSTWISRAEMHAMTNDSLILAVPSAFFIHWIKEYYLDLIREECFNVTGRNYLIDFRVCPELDLMPDPDPATPSTVLNATSLSAPTPPPLSTAPVAVSSTTDSSAKADNASFPETLNEKYTFDRFIVGGANQFAHAAAKAVADLPGGHYNPLFIYGGVGLGKTHLINAIGMELRRTRPHLRILYLCAEKFMNELINSIRYDKMEEFRQKYRNQCDVLLIDDIQFIAGKERTQEEFFHTFNTLHESAKQIVLTSDKFPKDIPGIEDRLKSRFEWGLIADIQPPDLETRVAILKKKAEVNDIRFSDDVALFIASAIKSNVRELEGSLIRLSAYASLHGEPITIDLAQKLLQSIIKEDISAHCSVETIQKRVADYYNIKIADLKSARRLKTLALPRQIAMYLCKKHLQASYPELGTKFGGKDHTTVMHAVKKIDRLCSEESKVREEVEALSRSITMA